MNSNKILYLLIAVFTILFFLFNRAVPFFSDDVWLINTLDKGNASSYFSSLIQSQINIWLNENGRAVNHIVWQVLVNCGELYYDCFISLVFAGILYLLRPIYMREHNNANFFSFSLIILCLFYLSPASESNFYWAAGGCHYLWPCLLSLLFFRILKYMQLSSKKSLLLVILFSIMSFVSGWTHEIFALPISFALVVHVVARYIKNSEVPSAYMWVVMVSYWIGTSLIVISPGTWHRIMLSYGGDASLSLVSLVVSKLVVSFKIFRYGRLFYVALTLLVIMMIRNKKRIRQFISENIFVFLCWVSAIAMVVILGVGGRAVWSIELFSLILSLKWVDTIVKERNHRLIANRCGWLLSVLMIIHLLCLVNPYFVSWNTYKEIAHQSTQEGFCGTVRMNQWKSDCWLIDKFVAHPYDMAREDIWMRLPLHCEVCRSDVFDYLISTSLSEDSIVNVAGDFIVRKTQSVDEYIDNGQVVMTFAPFDWNMTGGPVFVAWHKFVSYIWSSRYPSSYIVNRDNVTKLNIGGIEYYRFESPYAPIPRDISSVSVTKS